MDVSQPNLQVSQLQKWAINEYTGLRRPNERTMISGVVFDMDGLMFDTEALAMDAWNDAGKRCGYPLTRSLMLATIGLSEKDTADYLNTALGSGFDYKTARDIAMGSITSHIQEYGVPIKPGLLPLLDHLRELRLRLAVASSSPGDHIRTLLESAHVTPYFQAILSADSVGTCKPAPDIYLAAAEALDLDPRQCLALEDSPSGIRSAFDAGLLPVMVPDLIPADPNLTPFLYAQCETLSDVIDLIDAHADGKSPMGIFPHRQGK